ncbi:Thioredoxin-like fold [Pseudocohnilembus persalinus]|uniref:Thioredoxin-like fold n=1 Tax=Pseudocohnilembus persalinus TaxID=266149 RepID=A0A0V0Q821_PSEPJ|nr:Thioredoxin-like fold [Pseudocohnilembus persalinus]|eukprot:KRW98196.1 Thioredoxin-like fold [Pseudocohnilembus persalinus]
MQDLKIQIVSSRIITATQKNKCSGEYGKGVYNLCQSYFPDEKSHNIWFIKFYAPWCGHCKQLHPKWQQLGQQLSQEEGIKIGAIDCTQQINQALCQKNKVQGYPTLKIFYKGKSFDYNGQRELQNLKQHVLNFKKKNFKPSPQLCQQGLVKIQHNITPLCPVYYPKLTSKHNWIILFYYINSSNNDKDIIWENINEIGLQLGSINNLNKINQKFSRLQALDSLANKFQFQFSKNSYIKDDHPIAKVGGFCCDCDKKNKKFCSEQNIQNLTLNLIANQQQYNIDISAGEKDIQIKKILQQVFEKLQYLKISDEL